MVGNMESSNTTSIDLRTQAAELAHRLGSLRHFRAAAGELLANMRQSHLEAFRMQTRKVSCPPFLTNVLTYPVAVPLLGRLLH